MTESANVRKRRKELPDDTNGKQSNKELPDDAFGRLRIKQLAPDDRPREKALKKGFASLSDAELIAILIRTGNADETAIHVAQKILSRAGNNLNTLAKLSVKELMKIKGVGTVKAVTIAAAMELGKRRDETEPEKRDVIQSTQDAFRLFYPVLCDLQHEELWVALTNNAAKVIDKKKISQGGIGETSADLRLILNAAVNAVVETPCHGIILCHNHPSGNVKPSAHDDLLTSRLGQVAQMINIQLLDHIIISDKYYYSYADEGRI